MKQEDGRISPSKPEVAHISGRPSHTIDNLISEKRLIKHESHPIPSSGPEPSSQRGGSRRILTPVLAAELFGCDKKTITRWAREGYIPAHPMGKGKKKKWRFFEDELIDWLMDQKNRALAA